MGSERSISTPPAFCHFSAFCCIVSSGTPVRSLLDISKLSRVFGPGRPPFHYSLSSCSPPLPPCKSPQMSRFTLSPSFTLLSLIFFSHRCLKVFPPYSQYALLVSHSFSIVIYRRSDLLYVLSRPLLAYVVHMQKSLPAMAPQLTTAAGTDYDELRLPHNL